jgi:hypothetical protein
MSKRKKFVTTSLILAVGFLGFQFLDNQFRFLGIGILALLTITLFAWSLREGLGKNMTLLTLVLPALFTLGVGIFWFLLPAQVYARLPIIIFYALGIYVLALTSNIFTVGAIRTIALLRAARGVGFVLTLVTSFLIYDAILSLKIQPFISAPAVALFSFPLFLQGYWTSTLDTKFSKDIYNLALISALLMGEVALGLYFWPVTVVVGSLFLTVGVYMLLGLGQAKIEDRLFYQTIREYLLVGVLVFLGMLFSTHWRG